MSGAAPGTRHEFTVEADSDVRLDLILASMLGVSRTQAATLIANGHVSITSGDTRASYRPRAGEVVSVFVPAPPSREVLAEQIPLSVIYEDDDVVVVDKPAGMVVHPAPGNWSGTLVNALLGRGQSLSAQGGAERAGIVHRLDKETSGLLLVARNDRAHRLLSAAIAARRVVRRYAVLSWGHLESEEVTVDRAVARDQRDRTKMAVVRDGEGKGAKTTFRRLARFDSTELLRAQLFTGRTHQIRVHLASIGHPVVGDDTYGGGGGRRVVALAPKRHFLHAAWLRFRQPTTGAPIDLRSPLPPDLRVALAQVAKDESLREHPDPLELFGFFDETPASSAR